MYVKYYVVKYYRLPWWLKQWRLWPGFSPWVEKIPWRKKWQPTAVFFPGKSPWTEEPGGPRSTGLQEADTTEWLSLAHAFLFTEESLRFPGLLVSFQAPEIEQWLIGSRLFSWSPSSSRRDLREPNNKRMAGSVRGHEENKMEAGVRGWTGESTLRHGIRFEHGSMGNMMNRAVEPSV